MSAVEITLPILLAVLLAASLPVGTNSQTNWVEPSQPLYCYQCNSGVDRDCPSLQANNTNSIYYKPCNDYKEYKGHKPFCRKIVQTIFERENMVRVIRKCGWEKHPRLDCYFMSNDDHLETVCQCFHDGCNGAPRVSLTVAPLAALALAHLLGS